MNIEQISSNVHRINFQKGDNTKVALLSDIHWDNPKSDWALLKKDLDYCLEHKIPVHINGDLFCLMQGRGDKRGSKSDIRPEHNNSKYLDSIVNTAVEWFEPYKDILSVIGYGNHEFSIVKYQETDVLRRFVDRFNMTYNANVFVGGYGGWMIYTVDVTSTSKASFKHKYFHGSGGGGVVTKGAINLTRATSMYGGFDIFSMGHIHENMARTDSIEVLNHIAQKCDIELKEIHMAITGAYKEEYGDGSKGWHVERGAPPKTMGGRILDLTAYQKTVNGKYKIIKMADSYRFPI